MLSNPPSSLSRKLVWVAVVLLFVLHHDFWWWDDRTLVLGFMPIGLFYHVLFSIAASLVWVCAVNFAWPARIEEWASGDDPDRPAATPDETPAPPETRL